MATTDRIGLKTRGLERKRRARESKGDTGPWSRGNGRRRPCLAARKNAGIVTGLEQRNALARLLLPPDRVAGGKSPSGGCQGQGKDIRGVTASRQVAGANLAYRFLDGVKVWHTLFFR